MAGLSSQKKPGESFREAIAKFFRGNSKCFMRGYLPLQNALLASDYPRMSCGIGAWAYPIDKNF